MEIWDGNEFYLKYFYVDTSCFSKWDWWSSVLVPLWGSPSG